ncbi:MAG: DUF2207 domain-containing protein [Candidatus Muiribacteriota bacterium]
MRKNLILTMFFIIFSYFIIHANEAVTKLDVKVEIQKNGSLIVTENITVKALNQQIKHGIYRTFPTSITTEYSKSHSIPFKILSVKKDGVDEKYSISRTLDYTTVTIGDSEVTLPTGEYTYELKYLTDRHVEFGETTETLNWNILGGLWRFTVFNITCEFILPAKIDFNTLKYTAYTGYGEGKGKNFESFINNDGNLVFKTNKSFQYGEIFKAEIEFPKDYFSKSSFLPPFLEKSRDDYPFYGVILIGIILFIFYFIVWIKYGIDPAKSSVIPRFEPPKAIYPHAARYILNGFFDDKVFSSALLSLAAKGYIKIEDIELEDKILKRKKRGWRIRQLTDSKKFINSEEKELYETLFKNSILIDIDGNYSSTLNKAKEKLSKHMNSKYNDLFTHKGDGIAALAMLTGYASIIGLLMWATKLNLYFLAGLIGVFIMQVGLYGVRLHTGSVFKQFKEGVAKFGTFFNQILLFLTVLGITATILGIIAMYYTIPMAYALGGIVLINLLFEYLIKAPSKEGREIMDELLGFRLYLSVAEKHQMNFENPPEKTPELFEKFLPYAYALDLDMTWAQGFGDIINEGTEYDKNKADRSYHYRNISLDLTTSGFDTSLSNSSTSVDSSSSSDSSGSGGAGGGGGGGGW